MVCAYLILTGLISIIIIWFGFHFLSIPFVYLLAKESTKKDTMDQRSANFCSKPVFEVLFQHSHAHTSSMAASELSCKGVAE